MAGNRKKSKKLSEPNSIKLLNSYTYFVERNLGRFEVPKALKAAGANVVVHHDVLPHDSPDEDWIKFCGRKDFIAITEDKHIRYRQHELEAIRSYNARVIVLRAKRLTGVQKGEVIAKALPGIAKLANKTQPPFVAGLVRSGILTLYDF